MASVCLGLGDVTDEYDYRSGVFLPAISPIRDGYLTLAERIEEAVKRDALNARISLVAHNSRTATYDIDRCIRATVPSDSFREMAIRRWEGKQSSHKVHAWTSVVLTAAGIGAAIAASPYIALASVVTAIYAGVQFYRAGQASDQVAGWRESPAAKLASKRKEAYEKGFSYVYNKDLKLGEHSHHAVLLPHEVEYLYKRYTDRTCVELSAQRCVNDQQKKSWFDRFLSINPASSDVLLYVFGRVPEAFSSLSRNFETVSASLKNIEAEFSNYKKQRKEETNEVIKRIELQKSAAIAIPSAALHYKLNEARDERDRRLRVEGRLFDREIKREYESSRDRYYALYTAAVLPINIYFDGKVKEARDALKEVLATISTQEANAFSPYYEYAQSLVTATAAAQNPGYVYVQPPFNPMQYHQIPSLPKIEINFIYQQPTGGL